MRAWLTGAAAAAATVGIGTPILAALILPFVFPVVVAAGVVYAWRIDGR